MSDLKLRHAGRVTLGLAKVPARDHAAILDALERRMDRDAAEARRNAAVRDAHRLVGYVRIVSGALTTFYSRTWPRLRHLAEPPADAKPVERAYFFACQAADDCGKGIPTTARQIRRIVDGP
jgi:hypothetical protein